MSGAPSALSATYDAAGNLASETYPNGLVATRHYDNAGDPHNVLAELLGIRLGHNDILPAPLVEQGSIDLCALPADRRGGRLDYLQAKGLCGDCFQVTREKRRELERKSWVTAKCKEEDSEASAWASRDGYAPLSGSAKQAAFANRVRYDLMRQLYE